LAAAVLDAEAKASNSQIAGFAIEFANQIPWEAVALFAGVSVVLATAHRWIPWVVYCAKDEALRRNEKLLEIEERRVQLRTCLQIAFS
jgi:hypothetical protein